MCFLRPRYTRKTWYALCCHNPLYWNCLSGTLSTGTLPFNSLLSVALPILSNYLEGFIPLPSEPPCVCVCSKAIRKSLETPGTFSHKIWFWSSEFSYDITFYKINFKITSKWGGKKSLYCNSSVNRQVIMANTNAKNRQTQMLYSLGSTHLKTLATHWNTNSKIVSSRRNWILNSWLE